MKFKHTFSVFIDNFKTTYKLLLYRLIVLGLAVCVYASIVFPLISRIANTQAFVVVSEHIANFFIKFAELDFAGMQASFGAFKTSIESLFITIAQFRLDIIWGAIAIILTFIVQNVFLGLGNYVTGALVNDKMALQANSSFIGTLIKNLDKAFLYNLVYVPLTFIYDLVCAVGAYLLFFVLLRVFILLQVFLFVSFMVVAITIKSTFVSDWLPAMIYGNMGPIKAMRYSFRRKGKNTGAVMSHYLILTLIIFALNMASIFFTLGAGFIITVSMGNVLCCCFAFVNYCEDNKHKYFLDRNTIIRPEIEHQLTREEFFRGENK